jgi:hypothetical protein
VELRGFAVALAPDVASVPHMRRILPLAAACLALAAAVPAAADATLYGVESNSELANSNLSRPQQAETLGKMKAQGVGLVRANVHWNEAAPAACATQTPSQLRDPDNACYSWGVFDGIVEEATAHNIQVLVSVTHAPSWLHNNADPTYLGASGTQWRRTVQYYSAFLAAAAKRYGQGSPHGTVRLWTIWNEPNSRNYFGPMNTPALVRAAPGRYSQMFAEGAKAIRSSNPGAIVALGPTGPQSTPWKPITYIKAVQAKLPIFLPGTGASEKAWIGAWAHNPYPGITGPPSRGTTRSPSVGMANIRDLVKQLDAAPITRGLRIWATEFAYQTNPPDDVLGIAPALQGRYLAEAFDWLDATRRVTVVVWYGFTDPTDIRDWQGGTYYAGGTPKVSLLWWRRPISVPISLTRRGGVVRVWARSMVNPRATRIAYSFNGRQWRLFPVKGKRADGTTVLAVRMTRRMWFATWDGTRGPARVVSVR